MVIKFRKLAPLFYLQDKAIRIGGEGLAVEIDECCITNRKYNRGRMLRHTNWIFEPDQPIPQMKTPIAYNTFHQIVSESLTFCSSFINGQIAYQEYMILCITFPKF